MPGSGKASRGRLLERGFIIAMFVVWIAVTAWDLFPSRIGWDVSLPLHFCDIGGIIAPFAILTRQRQLRIILYYWAFALCGLAIVTPVVHSGPRSFDFWLYWCNHGTILMAAVYDLAVHRFRPIWKDYGWIVLTTFAYVGFVLPIDLAFDVNYGYLGNTSRARPMMLLLGRWPQRIPLAVLIVAAVFAILTVIGVTASRWEARRLQRDDIDAEEDETLQRSELAEMTV